ncbi:MAG: hypothetical protein WCK32_00880 [Chlorobiaceae bacterium]
MNYSLEYIQTCPIGDDAVRNFIATAVIDGYERRYVFYSRLWVSTLDDYSRKELSYVKQCLAAAERRLNEYKNKKQLDLF